MKVKVCGLHNLENFRQVLALQPDYVGLNFYSESKRFCKFEKLPELELGQSKLVGVFVNADLEFICKKTNNFKLSFIQLHGTESADAVAEVKKALPDCKIIKVFGIEEPRDLEDINAFNEAADFYLFDKKAISFGGTGRKFDWDLLNRNPPEKEFFLAGGIGPEDIRPLKLLGKVMPQLYCIDINSRFEDKAGLKQVDLISKFIEECK